MSHQDWDPVVFKKRIPVKVKEAKAKGLTTQQNTNKKNVNYENTVSMRKLENEEVEIKKIEHSVSKIIQKARMDAKLSQKDLAQKWFQEASHSVPMKNKLKLIKMLKIF